MFKLIENDASTISQWDEFVYSHVEGTIFHTSGWLRIIANNQPLKIKKLSIFHNNELVGILPLCVKHFLCIKVAGSPFVIEDTPYMGPVIDRSQILDLLPALDGYLKKNGISFLRVMSDQPYHVENRHNRYHFIEKHTHILDITKSKDDLWKNLEGRCRTAIRKARKSGIVVNVVKNKTYIEKYYLIIEQIYHSQNKPCPNQKAFYYDMWDAFGQSNAIFLSAKYHGEIIGGVIILVDRKRAYYLNGASKHDFRSLSASNLLLWEAINIAKEKGAEQFDFVGSNIPRLAKFKKSFGGQLVMYSLIEKSGSKWVSILRDKYPYYKQKMGNLRQFFQQRFLPRKKFR